MYTVVPQSEVLRGERAVLKLRLRNKETAAVRRSVHYMRTFRVPQIMWGVWGDDSIIFL